MTGAAAGRLALGLLVVGAVAAIAVGVVGLTRARAAGVVSARPFVVAAPPAWDVSSIASRGAGHDRCHSTAVG